MAKINVLNREVTIASIQDEDYICLTDIAKHRNADEPRFIIQNWMRTRSTMEFLGIWEFLNNPDFNRVEFEAVRNESGSNAFVMTPTKWVGLTHAIGIISKAGRYGGWEENSGKKGNMRDDADVTQLVCLSNLENLNALFIAEGIPQAERLKRLNAIAIHQMSLLTSEERMQLLSPKDDSREVVQR